jgi:ATP adenylyltransferase
VNTGRDSPPGDPPFGPDAIWAPWRLAYLESQTSENPSPGPGPAQTGSGSFLLDYWNAPDRDAAHHVIERDQAGMILLNKFPYANGHLLVALGDARPTLLDYDAAQRAALWSLVDRAAWLMRRVVEPQGMNIGLNEGRAAGAGVPSHLHVHLVPRWAADTNFITVVGAVRVIPGALDAMYERYAAAARETGREERSA